MSLSIQRANNKPAFGCAVCEQVKQIVVKAGNTPEDADAFIKRSENNAKNALNRSSLIGRWFKFGQAVKEFNHENFAQELMIFAKKSFLKA